MHTHEEWFSKARGDLMASSKLVKQDDLTLDSAIYHTQQCAEKSLKAYLAYKKQPIERTHNLIVLIEKCMAFDESFKKILSNAEQLNPYSIMFRYPDDRFFPERKEVEDALVFAREIFNFVKNKIASCMDPNLKIF